MPGNRPRARGGGDLDLARVLTAKQHALSQISIARQLHTATYIIARVPQKREFEKRSHATFKAQVLPIGYLSLFPRDGGTENAA